MKSCIKSSDRFRNSVIILIVLCSTFIHSMNPPVLIVSKQLNYTKPDGIRAIFIGRDMEIWKMYKINDLFNQIWY